MNSVFFRNIIFVSSLFFSAVSPAASVWQWTEPAGTLVGSPNFGFPLAPLYDEADKDPPVSWTELDEAPGYMGIDFNNATTISGTRFYRYQQDFGWNYITSYKVMGKPHGGSGFVELVSQRSATGSLPGWEEVSFTQDLYDSIQIHYTGVSFGYAPRVGELQFSTAVPTPAAIWLFGSALSGLGFFGKHRKSS